MKGTMKKAVAGVLAAAMVFGGSTGVLAAGRGCRRNSGCGAGGSNYTGTCSWFGEDGDGNFVSEGCSWLDEDGDGICDHCGKEKEDCASGVGHRVEFEDKDGDGVCDYRPERDTAGAGRGCRGRRRR